MTNFIDNIVSTFDKIYDTVGDNLFLLLIIFAILWGVQLLNAFSGYRLNVLGIYPRRAEGLLGIFTSPFLHGSYQHLFLNSIPLFILAALVVVGGKQQFFQITLFIMIVSGLTVWIFARSAYHVGASSLILGYWGFLLMNAYYEHSVMTWFVAFLCLYYLGGLVFSLFPQEERTSWEGHIAGFLSGVLASYVLAKGYI